MLSCFLLVFELLKFFLSVFEFGVADNAEQDDDDYFNLLHGNDYNKVKEVS